MRYCFGGVGVVGIQWDVDCGVGETRDVRGDG
jgi:hypothetical protein